MELELKGCLLTIRCEVFEESYKFKQEVIKMLIPWLKDYFRQDVSSAHSIPELIDK